MTDQRRQYKAWKQGQASQLTRERREKLESIGFAWQVRNRPEWEARFSELLEYRKKHGDCKVRIRQVWYFKPEDISLTILLSLFGCSGPPALQRKQGARKVGSQATRTTQIAQEGHAFLFDPLPP